MKFSTFLKETKIPIDFPLLTKYHLFDSIVAFYPDTLASFKDIAIQDKWSSQTFRNVKSMELSADITHAANEKKTERCVFELADAQAMALAYCKITANGHIVLITSIYLKCQNQLYSRRVDPPSQGVFEKNPNASKSNNANSIRLPLQNLSSDYKNPARHNHFNAWLVYK